MMQFSLNFYDIWLKEFASKNPIFLVKESFEITLIVVSAFVLVATLFRSFIFAVGNLRASKLIFTDLLQSVLYSKIKFFEKNDIGNIINRFSGDTNAIDINISFELNIFLKNLFTMIGSLIIIIIQ